MWPNNVQYFGTWENGYRHGTGVEKHQTYVYKGQWVKDSKQGYGVAVSKTGCSYEGTWNSDLHEGYGVEVYKDGGFYAGQFNKGVREGHGVRVVNPNTQLKEAFASKKGLSESTTEVPSVSDLEELLGAKIFEEFSPTDQTEVYRGQWKEDRRHGYGIERNFLGEVYEGGFKDNMKHGFGVLRANNDVLYYGKWRNNKLVKNNRTANASSQKASVMAKENCGVANRKIWLALSRAHGARRFGAWAIHEQREAGKHNLLAEEKEKEARSLKEVSTCRVAESPGTTRSKTALSRLSEMFSPLPSRKNSGSETDSDSPMGGLRKKSPQNGRKFSVPTGHRFLSPYG
eukprot:sb/3466379/